MDLTANWMRLLPYLLVIATVVLIVRSFFENRRDRRRWLALLLRSPTYLITPSTTFLWCPSHGSDRLVHGGNVRPGAGVEELKVPPNVWSTAGI